MIKLKSKLKLLNLCLLTSLATTSFATAKEHILVVPQCLLNKVTLQYNTLAKKNDFALIQANQNVLNKLITAKSIYKKNCGGFLNVTDEFNSQKSLIATKHSYGNFLNQFISQPSKSIKQDQYKIRFKQQVLATTNLYAESQALSDLTKFTQFEDRYADSDTGVAAAEWLQKQIKDIATQYNRDDIEITIIATNTYKQPSVVVKIGKDNNNPGVVIGGHLDTLEKGCDWQGYCGNRPGADDDGSGSITTLETARALIASGIQFKKPIYIMWYAAEEEGLIGSQKVVAAFKKAKIAIDAVLQFDMTGYEYKQDPTIWLMKDNVDLNLTQFLEKLIQTYVKKPVGYTKCGYACSDHASWSMKGFSAAMPFESEMNHDNPAIHTPDDVIDNLSMSHISDFVKLGIAFGVELAEPNKS